MNMMILHTHTPATESYKYNAKMCNYYVNLNLEVEYRVTR